MSPQRSTDSHHEWDKFRAARDLRIARRKHRRIPVALILATALFFALFPARRPAAAGPVSKPPLAYVAKVTLGPKREEVALPRRSGSAKRFARPYQTHNRRHPRFSRPELGPFDAYVLDDNRYIRVEGKDTYALVDTTTGKITWITKPDKHRAPVQHSPLDSQASNYADRSGNR